MTVKALVLTGYGLNCDYETHYALTLAGAESHGVHINELIKKSNLDEYRILVFGGGFSWADEHGAGVLLASKLKNNIGEQIQAFVRQGKLVLGICNGFQSLSNLGLLPGLDGDYTRRQVAVTYNDRGNFVDDWVSLVVEPNSPCVFTRGIEGLELPVRHGEGKVYASEDVLDRLESNGQVVMRYAGPDGLPARGASPANPNGSLRDIAGICDPTGRIFGLMPHPEAFNRMTNHPEWTRIKDGHKGNPSRQDGAGVAIFRNAVEFAERL